LVACPHCAFPIPIATEPLLADSLTHEADYIRSIEEVGGVGTDLRSFVAGVDLDEIGGTDDPWCRDLPVEQHAREAQLRAAQGDPRPTRGFDLGAYLGHLGRTALDVGRRLLGGFWWWSK